MSDPKRETEIVNWNPEMAPLFVICLANPWNLVGCVSLGPIRVTGLRCGRIGPLFQSDLRQSLYSRNVESGSWVVERSLPDQPLESEIWTRLYWRARSPESCPRNLEHVLACRPTEFCATQIWKLDSVLVCGVRQEAKLDSEAQGVRNLEYCTGVRGPPNRAPGIWNLDLETENLKLGTGI